MRWLLEELLAQSPEKSLIFSTDSQFGGFKKIKKEPFTLEEFWIAHDSGILKFNGFYRIEAS